MASSLPYSGKHGILCASLPLTPALSWGLIIAYISEGEIRESRRDCPCLVAEVVGNDEPEREGEPAGPHFATSVFELLG